MDGSGYSGKGGAGGFPALYAAAMAAGQVAAAARVPQPMIVRAVDPATGATLKVYEPVMDGVCGFAWVKIKGNTAFGKWAKKAGHASSAYPNGLWFWIGAYNQSMERKEAHAYAMAQVLEAAGVQAYADSRMD